MREIGRLLRRLSRPQQYYYILLAGIFPLVEAVKKRQGLERKKCLDGVHVRTYVSKSVQAHTHTKKIASIVLLVCEGTKMLRCFRDLGIRASKSGCSPAAGLGTSLSM